MLKFFLILGLILYSIYKIGSLFFKAGAASQQIRNAPPRPQANSGEKKKKAGHFKGDGEYIDYEEIK